MTRKETIHSKMSKNEAIGLLDSVISIAREPLVVLNHDFRVIKASRSFCDFFRVKTEEVLGRIIYSISGESLEIQKLHELLENMLLRNLSADRCEIEHDFFGTGRLIVLFSAQCIPSVQKGIKFILLAIENINGQTQPEKRDNLAIVAEGSAIPQFAISRDHKVILWNRALEVYSGVKEKDILGTSEHWRAFYHEKRPCLVDLVVDASAEDEITRWYGNGYKRSRLIDGAYEATGYFPIMKDGAWLHFTAAAIKDSSGNIVAGVETLEDVTSLKINEVLLRQAEEKYRSIFENAVEGMFQTTPDGRFLSINPSFAKLIGYSSPEELISCITDLGKQLYVNPEDRILFKEIIGKSGVIEDYEVQQYRKDGSIIWVSINARCVYDERGALKYYEGTFEDITSRRLAEEELKHTTKKLRQSLAGTIQAISHTVESRDPYTAGHQRRVSNLARSIAQEMGMSRDTIDIIRMAGAIHDIGKISVPAEILSKPGKLSDNEFNIMKDHSQTGYDILRDVAQPARPGKMTDIEMNLIRVHPQSGYDILKDVELPYPIAEIVLQHHERLDGSGYPRGLRGDEIILEARIISVADVVEAIASHRPYRPALGIDAALEEIQKNKSILYDERVVEACIRLFR